MNIDDIKILNIRPGDTVHISVDIQNATVLDARRFMQNIINQMEIIFPDPSIKIIVSPTGTYDINIISTMRDSSQDRYERAMKGVS